MLNIQSIWKIVSNTDISINNINLIHAPGKISVSLKNIC